MANTALYWQDGSLAILLLLGILLANILRLIDLANVSFYLVMNLVTTRLLRYGGTLETILLAYVLLLLLLFVLFERIRIWLFCIVLILVRIILLETNWDVLLPAEARGFFQQSRAHWILDAAMLALILQTLYWHISWRVAAEKMAETNQLLFEHMSHDIQKAFQSVSILSGQMAERAQVIQPDKGSPRILADLLNACNFYSFILNNFLDYARWGNGRLAYVHWEEMDLAADIGRIVDLYQYRADKMKISLHLEVADDVPGLIVSDRAKVNRIALNLLSNALEHTPAGKSVVARIGVADRQWNLSILNEGGMTEQELVRLVAPYSTGTHNRVGGRKGLGMPITRMLVDMLGGIINITSIPDMETNVVVSISVEIDKKEHPVIGERIVAIYDMDTKVLFAEDITFVRWSLKTAFQSMGLPDFQEVGSCESLLAALKKDRYTHLILDLSLTDGSALNVLSIICREYRALKILIFTKQPVGVYGDLTIKEFGCFYLSKMDSPLESILQMKAFIQNELLPGQSPPQVSKNPFWRLSRTERKLLPYIIQGFSPKVIAEKVGAPSGTVRKLKERILVKTHSANILELKELATKHGID